MDSGAQKLLSSLDESEIGFELAPEALVKLSHYCDLLELWGKKTDLIAPCSTQELIERHIRDSLRALHICSMNISAIELGLSRMKSPSLRLADIGSGAGLPGLVWSICLPKADVFLVEPREKRAIFLAEVRRKLGLENLTVIRKRFEEFTLESPLDLVVCRALGSRESFLLQASRVLTEEGLVVELLGSSSQEEEEVLRRESQKSGFVNFKLDAYQAKFPGDGKSVVLSAKVPLPSMTA